MVRLWIYKVILVFTSPEHAILISVRLLDLLKLPRIGLYCNTTLNSLRQTDIYIFSKLEMLASFEFVHQTNLTWRFLCPFCS